MNCIVNNMHVLTFFFLDELKQLQSDESFVKSWCLENSILIYSIRLSNPIELYSIDDYVGFRYTRI